MKRDMRVNKDKIIIAIGFGVLLFASGCAPQPPSGLSQEQQVMDAQRAAKPAGKPGTAMNGDEADAVYRSYLENIGKPLPAQDNGRSAEAR